MSDTTDEFWSPVQKAAASEFDALRRQWRDSVAELPMPEPGAVVNERFEVVREIGQGGFGRVFEVRHVHLGQPFALKLLTPRIAQRPGWRERFQEEARTTSQIGHPNIVFITDFGDCPTYGVYFAMEYLDGSPLSDVIKLRALDAAETLEMVRSIASALDAAHDREIVHCDLKPGNIFYQGGRARVRWKLLDFGASSIVMSAVETQTVYGTPAYMAPEHAMGEAVDRRADVFSLALVVYEALTQQPPWNVRMWLHATPRWRAERPPAPPSSLRDGIPKDWDEVILKALSIDPAKRYARTGDFADALRGSVEPTAASPPPIPATAALSPDTLLEMNPAANLRSSVMPGEFFVISRIQEGVTLAELKRLCTGLPFDLESTLQSMMERGYVQRSKQTRTPDVRRPLRPRPTEPTGPGLAENTDSEPLDVKALLNHVESLRVRGNFLGALETLRTALVTWPDIALLHYRYGMLLREFGKSPDSALAAFQRAVELEPGNDGYRHALKDMEARDE